MYYYNVYFFLSVLIDAATTKLWYIGYHTFSGISLLALDKNTYLQVQWFINLLGCGLYMYYYNVYFFLSVLIDAATTKLWHIGYHTFSGISLLALDKNTYLQVQWFINLLGCGLYYYNVNFFLSVPFDTTTTKLWYIGYIQWYLIPAVR